MPADTDRLEVYEAADGWRWRRVAANNRVIVPPEQHTSERDAWRAAYRACPDLDPSWTPVGVVIDTRPLDLLGQLLGDNDHDKDAIRTELGDRL